MTHADPPRLVVPAFGPLYAALAPYTAALVRLAAGLSLAAHGHPKLFGDAARSAAFFEQAGFAPGLFWNYAVGTTEFVGGLCLAAGFLTRLAAVPIVLFLVTAVMFHWPKGFYWNQGGFEYPLFWALVVLHFLVHGGGRVSLDAAIGREV